MKCQNCGQREGTLDWVGEGGALAWVHGGGQRWCELCVAEKQLEHAEAMAAALPTLQAKVAALKSAPAQETER